MIEPRNKDEHAYKWPKEETATDAVELAQLLVKATRDIVDRGCIMSYGWSVSSTFHAKGSKSRFNIDGIDGEPFLFAHQTHRCGAAMIVDPHRSEILFCPLEDWTAVEERELALLLKSQLAMPNHGSSMWTVDQINNSVLLSALYDQSP